MAQTPHPVDIHVGQRLKQRRRLLGLSQVKLGERLGLTFQQIQKYERGINRLGASRLFATAQILDVPVGYFFEDMTGERVGLAEEQRPFGSGPSASQTDRLVTLELVHAFEQIRDPALRRTILDMARAVAKFERASEPAATDADALGANAKPGDEEPR